jgi:hypothetical protein
MYYIYHIKGKKIGVSDKPVRRTKEQGFTEYEILEEFNCIYLVSYRERALQKEYGYPIDKLLYFQTLNNACFEGRSKGGKKNIKSGHLDKITKIATLKKYKKVIVYKVDGSFVSEYNSVKECVNDLHLGQGLVSKVLTGVRNHTGGYVIKYKT